MARFLCGIPGPAIQRHKLLNHDHFVTLSQIPFAEVLIITEATLG